MSDIDDITQLLYQKTLENKIKWNLSSDGLTIFTSQVSNIIEITSSSMEYEFVIRNSDGLIIEYNNYDMFSPGHTGAERLFATAKRLVLGTDKAIQDIKNRLQIL